MYTKQDLFRQLEKMNAPRDSIVLMHSSLRSVGQVEGGAQGLLDALVEYFTAEGGLFCVAAHTWGNLGSDRFTLDMTIPESNLGAFPRIAAADPRGLRTPNPIHSLVIFGDREKAEAFAKDEMSLKTSTAPESCHGKLCTQKGYVLLVGVGQDKNTYLHCVAEILNLPNRMAEKPIPVSIRMPDLQVIRKEMRLYHCDYCSDLSNRFPKYDTAFRYHGCITDGFVGNAPTQLCDAAKLKDTVELIFRNSGGEDPLALAGSIPPKWYCTKD